jgi:membrane protein YqaA with SNARE-associated domain
VDPSSLAAWGLPGLFFVALLSGSVVPLPSEAVLVALVGGGVPIAPSVAAATSGNVLGAATLYWLGGAVAAGRGGRPGRAHLARLSRDPERFDRARARLRRWGAPLLLFTWLPIVGDLFVVAAGFAGVRLVPFLIYTAIGKAARFSAVATAAAAAIEGLR